MKQLCGELGISKSMQDAPHQDGKSHEGGSENLVSGLQRLLAESKERDRDNVNLHNSINGLIAAMNEDMRKNAEMRSAYSQSFCLSPFWASAN